MNEFELTLTQEFDTQDANALANRLRLYMPVARPRFLMRKAEGDFPQFIQLVADINVWKAALSIAGGAFLVRVSHRLADVAVDKVAGFFKSDKVKPLAETAIALSDAKASVGKKATIQIGIIIEGLDQPTILDIDADDPAQIATAIALFVAQMDKMAAAMKADPTFVRMFGRQANAELLDDGALRVTWHFLDADGKVGSREITVR
jgi:hypothetical protein